MRAAVCLLVLCCCLAASEDQSLISSIPDSNQVVAGSDVGEAAGGSYFERAPLKRICRWNWLSPVCRRVRMTEDQKCATRVAVTKAAAKKSCQAKLDGQAAKMQTKEMVNKQDNSDTANDHQLYRYAPCMEMCSGLFNGTIWGLGASSKVMDGNSIKGELNGQYRPYYMDGQKNTTQRCEFVCKQPYRDSNSCGGVTLGLPKRTWKPTAISGDKRCCLPGPNAGFLNSGKQIYREYVETQSIPPPRRPHKRPISGFPASGFRSGFPLSGSPGVIKRKECPVYKLDVCNPSAMERSICVKRWDGLKKMQVASECRNRGMETFVYNHLLVKVSACKLADREKACVVDLRKAQGCQGKTLPWNQVSEAKCKAKKTEIPHNRGYNAKDFEECPYAGDEMIGTPNSMWTNRDKGLWRDKMLKKSPTLDCQMKSTSRVYRICWCDKPSKCEDTNDPKVDSKHCMMLDEKSGKWPNQKDGTTDATRCLNDAATKWLESGSLQGMDMVQW